MVNMVLKCCLIIVLFPNLIRAGCSFIEPLDNFDRVKSGIAWFSSKNMYAVRRYANGAESNTTCQKFSFRTPASETKTLYYADGSTSNMTFSLLPAKSVCIPARVEMNVKSGIPPVYYITYTDYEELWFIRACYNDEGGFNYLNILTVY